MHCWRLTPFVVALTIFRSVSFHLKYSRYRPLHGPDSLRAVFLSVSSTFRLDFSYRIVLICGSVLAYRTVSVAGSRRHLMVDSVHRHSGNSLRHRSPPRIMCRCRWWWPSTMVTLILISSLDQPNRLGSRSSGYVYC